MTNYPKNKSFFGRQTTWWRLADQNAGAVEVSSVVVRAAITAFVVVFILNQNASKWIVLYMFTDVAYLDKFDPLIFDFLEAYLTFPLMPFAVYCSIFRFVPRALIINEMLLGAASLFFLCGHAGFHYYHSTLDYFIFDIIIFFLVFRSYLAVYRFVYEIKVTNHSLFY